MTRKVLPKAIRQKREDLQKSGPVVLSAAKPPPDEEVPAPQSVSRHDAAQTSAPAIPSRPIASELPSVRFDDERQVARRLTMARKIVERHKMYAAVGGLLPLPIVNVAGVTAINMRMFKALSDLYGLPFERDRTRSIVMGFMGGAVPTGLAAATASTLAFVVPGSGFVGLAVSSFTAAAFTRGIGMAFVEQFESGTKSEQ